MQPGNPSTTKSVPEPPTLWFRLFPPLLFLLVCLVIIVPLLGEPGNLGVDDWDQHTFYSAVPRDTILRYHQLPFWNPYYCGGNVLLANAQARFASPSFLLVLLFGTLPGIKLEIALHLLLGLWGTYLFARTLRLGPISACLPALVFMVGGVFPAHLSKGHTWIMAYAYLPWMMFFFERSRKQLRFVSASAVCLALMILDGGTYAFPHALFVLALYAVACAVRQRSFAPLWPALIIPPLSLLLSAFRFLPLLDFFRQEPRLVDSTDHLPLSALYHVFLDRTCHPWGEYFPGQFHGWHEYSAYLGYVPVALGLIGLIILARRDRRTIPLGIVFLVLALGDFASWSPWHLLHQAAPFSSLRAPSRFLFPFLFIFGLWAGSALSTLENRAVSPGGSRFGWPRMLALLLLVFSAADLVLVNGRHLRQAFPISPIPVQRQDTFKQITGNPGTMYAAFQANQGTIRCYEPAQLPKNAQAMDSPHYRGEVYLARGSGEAEFLSWSPNRLSISVRAEESDLLVINQNFERGWRAEGNRQVENWHGLVALPVTPGQRQVVIHYRPRWFLPGVALSALGLLLTALIWRRRRPRINKGIG